MKLIRHTRHFTHIIICMIAVFITGCSVLHHNPNPQPSEHQLLCNRLERQYTFTDHPYHIGSTHPSPIYKAKIAQDLKRYNCE